MAFYELVGSAFGGILAAGCASFVSGVIGYGLRMLYERTRTRWRLRTLARAFGDLSSGERVLVVMPVFEPRTYASDTDDKTWVYKPGTDRTAENGLPLHSDVLVVDDYLAFEQLANAWGAKVGYTLSFQGDEQALGSWKKSLIVLIGGPRSNRKLRQVLDSLNWLTMDDAGQRDTDWRLTYTIGQRRQEALATETQAKSVYLRVSNPYYTHGKIVALWGNTGDATLAAARYAADNYAEIARWARGKDFIMTIESMPGQAETARLLDRKLAP